MFESVMVMSLAADMVTVALSEPGVEISPVTTASRVLLVTSIVVPAVIAIPAEPSLATRAFTVEFVIEVLVPDVIVMDALPDITEAVIVEGSIETEPLAVMVTLALLPGVVPETVASISAFSIVISVPVVVSFVIDMVDVPSPATNAVIA